MRSRARNGGENARIVRSSAGALVTEPLIDVWDIETFDPPMRELLAGHADLLSAYHATARENLILRELSDRTSPYPTNPFAEPYSDLTDIVAAAMADRSIRGWHYTRLTDAEVDRLRERGVGLSNIAAIRARLDAQVEAGAFTAETADALHAASPFLRGQNRNRSGQFWMVSHPRDVESPDVNLLLGSWGGEGVYFWLADPAHKALVASLGRARVIEIAAPLAATQHADLAAKAVMATYSRSLGSRPASNAFDLYVTEPLPASAVLAVHTEAEPSFSRLGRGFPARYTNADIGGWDEIAAEIARRRR